MTIPTDEKIEALRWEAAAAGDLAQVALCEEALDGDLEARASCLASMQAAGAMREAE